MAELLLPKQTARVRFPSSAQTRYSALTRAFTLITSVARRVTAPSVPRWCPGANPLTPGTFGAADELPVSAASVLATPHRLAMTTIDSPARSESTELTGRRDLAFIPAQRRPADDLDRHHAHGQARPPCQCRPLHCLPRPPTTPARLLDQIGHCRMGGAHSGPTIIGFPAVLVFRASSANSRLRLQIRPFGVARVSRIRIAEICAGHSQGFRSSTGV